MYLQGIFYISFVCSLFLSGQKSRYPKKQERKLLYIRAEGKKITPESFQPWIVNFFTNQRLILRRGL
ncbi:hypothetical protein CBFG_03988 [Clostridiales bacterium 1_7_47FAA]|nr:hypothetical protein CBFG_03988 [Clostridiales bacterium 1_7_47FAA]